VGSLVKNIKHGQFYSSSKAYEKVSKAILISGTARNGTTITGQLIHSMNNVEYAFEPPTLLSLINAIDKIEKNIWKFLYETYLYEDFLINAIAGRNINFNKNDDSSIYYAKTEEEIQARMKETQGKYMCENKIKESVIAFKSLNNIEHIIELKNYYPSTKIVILLRDAPSAINSILHKKWFANSNSEMIWPLRKYKKNTVPFFVFEGEEDFWCSLSELDKAAFYYIKINKKQRQIKDAIFVKYNELINNPISAAESLASSLNLNFGPLTQSLITKIKPTFKEFDPGILDKISVDMRNQVKSLSSFAE